MYIMNCSIVHERAIEINEHIFIFIVALSVRFCLRSNSSNYEVKYFYRREKEKERQNLRKIVGKRIFLRFSRGSIEITGYSWSFDECIEIPIGIRSENYYGNL